MSFREYLDLAKDQIKGDKEDAIKSVKELKSLIDANPDVDNAKVYWNDKPCFKTDDYYIGDGSDQLLFSGNKLKSARKLEDFYVN